MLWYVLPALVILIVVIAYPLVYALIVSLENWNLLSGLHQWIGLGNYTGLFQSGAFYESLKLTAIYTGASVALELVLGLALALIVREGIRRALRGFQAIRVLLLLPFAIAPLIWGFYFTQLMDPSFGTFDQLLKLVHGPDIAWVNNPHLALASLVVVDVWQWTPFMFTIILGGLLSLPDSVREAAMLDGASWVRRLVYVELPLLRPVILVALLIRVIDSLKYLDIVYVLTGGGPGTATNTLNFFGFNVGFSEYLLGQAAAIAFVVFVIIMLATVAILGGMRGSTRGAE